MFSTRKRWVICTLIWRYQKFYTIPPKNGFWPKNGQIWLKLAFLAKYQHFWPIWSNAWPKNNADKLSRWFSVMLVPKLLLTPIKIRICGPILALLPNIGIFGPFGPMPDQKTMRTKCYSGFMISVYHKFCSLAKSSGCLAQKWPFLPQNMLSWVNFPRTGKVVKMWHFLELCCDQAVWFF